MNEFVAGHISRCVESYPDADTRVFRPAAMAAALLFGISTSTTAAPNNPVRAFAAPVASAHQTVAERIANRAKFRKLVSHTVYSSDKKYIAMLVNEQTKPISRQALCLRRVSDGRIQFLRDAYYGLNLKSRRLTLTWKGTNYLMMCDGFKWAQFDLAGRKVAVGRVKNSGAASGGVGAIPVWTARGEGESTIVSGGRLAPPGDASRPVKGNKPIISSAKSPSVGTSGTSSQAVTTPGNFVGTSAGKTYGGAVIREVKPPLGPAVSQAVGERR